MGPIEYDRPDWLAYEELSHELRSAEIARLFGALGAWLAASLRHTASTPMSLDTRIGTPAR